MTLALDVLVALLLVVTIGYAWILNKRLGNLRQDKGELEKMALNFHMATDRAEKSIAKLKTNVDVLQDCIKTAESLRDDLIFLSERGGTAADRLEVAVRAARDEAGVSPAPVKQPAQPSSTTPSPIPEGVKPPIDDHQRPVLRANPEDERRLSDNRTDEQKVSDAERELLKALRSAG